MPSDKTRLGTSGEQLAASYLVGQGMRILARNFRTRYGEVDLVASDADTVVFVEVKTRRSQSFGTPEESVTERKRRRLALAAHQYLQEQGLSDCSWRVDIVSVLLRAGQPEIRHLPAVSVDEPIAP